MSSDVNAQQRLVAEIADLLSPLLAAAASDWHRRRILDALGWDLSALAGMPPGEFEQWLESCASAVAGVVALVERPPEDFEGLARALDTADAAVSVATGLPPSLRGQLPDAPPAQLLLDDLLTFLVVDYLQRRAPAIYETGRLLNLVRAASDEPPSAPFPATGVPVRLPKSRPRLRLDALPDLIADPLDTLRLEYLPHGLDTAEHADAAADKLFARIAELLLAVRVPARYGVKPGLGPDFGEAGNALVSHMLTVAARLGDGELGAELGLGVALSSEDRGGLGLVLLPWGALELTTTADRWELGFELGGAAGGFAIGPDGLVLPEGVAGRIHAGIRVRRLPAVENGLAFLVGSARGTRLEIGGFHGAFAVEFGTGRDDADVHAMAENAAIVLASTDGDGFLRTVLPAGGLRTDFELGAGWSLRRGLYLHGSGGLDAALPLQTTLGPTTVRFVHLWLHAADGELTLGAGLTADLRLGPVTAAVARTGLEAAISFPATGGNLGPAALALDFKPPDGVGLSIDAGAVTGGGFLFFDEPQARYAGALHLDFERLTLNAVGLLTTRLPGNRPGFSLLVLISAAGFEPIQLGFGFTLNRVGGLLGVNRTAALEQLTGRFNDGSLSPLLFSDEDPVPRADAIVSALDQVFPPAADRFVFGPMARIGWGSPTLVTLDVALLLELPAPVRLIVVGELAAVLPRPEDPLVELHVDVLGVVDFDRRTASVDGRLRDSRIVAFALTGAMALRASWGEQPAFVLAVGGLHPRFQRPPDFPQLERVALTLVSADSPPVASSDTPRLRLEAYLAVTANTIQLGARAELAVKVGRFGIDGQLAFDTLVQLEPLEFVADIAATLAIKSGSSTLFGVDVAVTLTGPAPWRARGTATLQILFFKASVSFDLSFGGGRDELPPRTVDLWSLLEPELRKPANWSAALPAGGSQMVTLAAAAPPPAGELLVHPLGSLRLSQRTVPLDTDITRFGGAGVGPDRRFSVASAAVGGRVVVRPPRTTEYFARAQFQDMTDEERLAAPSFERLASGVELVAGDKVAGPAVAAPIGYETVILEREGEPRAKPQPQPYAMPQADVDAVARFGPAATADVRTTGRERYRAPEQPVAADDGSYRLAWRDRLQPVEGLDGADGAYANAAAARDGYLRAHPDQRDRVQVVREHELV